MFKKFALVIALVLVLAPVTSALAIRYWDGGGDTGTDSWATANNWTGDTVPGSTELMATRGLHGSSSNVTDVDTADCVAGTLVNGYGTPTIMPSGPAHTLNILNGGTLALGTMQNACNSGAATGYAVGTINVYAGGTLTVDNYLNLTHPNGNAATSENGGHGTLNMYGGLIDLGTTFSVSRNAVGNHYGEVHLDGGEIYAGSFYMGFHSTEPPTEDPDKWVPNTIADSMDVSGGVLYVKGDVQTQIEGYIDNGWITAYDGAAGTKLTMELVTLASPKAGSGQYTKLYAEIPEPGTMLLAGFGVLVLLVSRRKR